MDDLGRWSRPPGHGRRVHASAGAERRPSAERRPKISPMAMHKIAKNRPQAKNRSLWFDVRMICYRRSAPAMRAQSQPCTGKSSGRVIPGLYRDVSDSVLG